MRRARADRRAMGMAEEDAVAEVDLAHPTPDVEELFRHYDALYFQGALTAAGFTVKWGSSPQSSSFGSCTFSKPRNTITLFEPVLKYCSCTDLKKALLHEMIHAIIYVKHHMKGCNNHGPVFRAWMDAINACSIEDPQRPVSGYNITTRHDFEPEKPFSFKGFLWKCESCGDTLQRAKKQGPPSDACCIEKVDHDATCGNMLCYWHNHKNECGGSYENMGLQSVTPVQKKVPKGTQLLLTFPSEASKSKGAIQESNSTELRENTKVTKPNAEDEHLPLSSLMKVAKRCRSEVVQKALVLTVKPPKEVKTEQALIAMEKHGLFSPVCCNDARLLGIGTSKNTGKQHKSEDVQIPIVPTERHKIFSLEGGSNRKSLESSSLQKTFKRCKKASTLPDEPRKEMNRKRALVATEEHELFSPGGCNDATSPGNGTSNMASKQHKPESVQRPSAPSATSQGKPKLTQEFVTTEVRALFSLEACNYAKSQGSNTSKQADEQHKPTITQTACSQHAYPLRRRKKDLVQPEKNELLHVVGCSNGKLLDKSSSKKARKYHEPEDIKKTTVLPAVHGRNLKQSSIVASQRQQRKCRRQPAKKKEYAVMSAWVNIYESDRSSGSTQSLVNKRTVRRKKGRERIQTYCGSKKGNSPTFDNSRIGASVSSHKSGTSPSCNTVVSITAERVLSQVTGGHSQTSAPCLDIVPLQSADAPPDIIPPDPDSAIIDISDDD